MRRILLAALIALYTAAAGAADLHDIVTKGSTDRSVTVDIMDSVDGTPENGVVFNTAGIDLWYRREGAASVDVTEATLAALTTAHTDGGFLLVNDGAYRLDLPDAAYATGANYVDFGGTVTGMIVIGGRVRLIDTSLEVANLTANVIQVEGADATNTLGTAQTGDAFARLGAPVGASISADLQVIDANVDDIETDTGTTGVLVSSGTGAGQISISSGVVAANATQISGDSAAADEAERFFDGTAGAFPGFGIKARGTAQAYTAGTPSVTLATGETFGDNTLEGNIVWIRGSTQGYWQEAIAVSNVGSSDVVTLDEALTVAATGTIEYVIFGVPESSGGSGGLDAAGVRAAVGLASANLDTQLGTIDGNVDAVLVDTGTTLQGELDGIQADTEDLQTRVPAALVSGRMDSSTGAMAANVMTAAAAAADLGTELGTATWATTTRLLTAGTNIVLAKGTGVTGFNDLSAAQVNTEVDTALSDLNLQFLFSSAYDPASKPGNAAGLLNVIVENDAGVPRFTTNSLENAPAGGGGGTSDWSAGEREQLRHRLGIDGTASAPSATPSLATAATVGDVLADTNELQTDWANGGRLDNILDARASQASVDDVPTNAELATALGTADDAVLAAIEQTARADAAILNCEVNTANFAGSTTTVACLLTDRDGGAITAASGDLEGRELLILSGAQIYEGRFINDTTWDSGTSELRLTLSRALPGTLADAVTAIIR